MQTWFCLSHPLNFRVRRCLSGTRLMLGRVCSHLSYASSLSIPDSRSRTEFCQGREALSLCPGPPQPACSSHHPKPWLEVLPPSNSGNGIRADNPADMPTLFFFCSWNLCFPGRGVAHPHNCRGTLSFPLGQLLTAQTFLANSLCTEMATLAMAGLHYTL